jgi:hypothetical protein
MADLVSKFPNVLAVFTGEKAFKKVLTIRYSPSLRPRIRNLYKGYDKADSLLVLFHNKRKDTIESRFFINTNNVPDIKNEGDENMFNTFQIKKYLMAEETMKWEAEDPYTKKTNTYLRSLLKESAPKK